MPLLKEFLASLRADRTTIIPLLLVAFSAGAQQAANVEVTAVRLAPLRQTITLAGSLRSPQFSALSARVDGYVTSVTVEAGDHVEPGQVLITLDDEVASLELQRMQAVLSEAQTLLADQRRRVQEAADLIEANNFSRSEHASLRAELAARQARLEQYRAETEIQRTRLARHRVTAPFAGVVTAKLVEVGRQVGADTSLLQIARMEPIWAEAQIPERHFRQVTAGTPVRVSPGFDGSVWLRSEVSHLVPVSADGSRTFLVRTELPNPQWQLAPGMSVRMELSLGADEEDTLQVPADAIIYAVDGTQQVWEVTRRDESFIAEPRSIQVGRRAASLVEVSGEGLEAGSLVVTRGNENLQVGEEVTINNADQIGN
jgi:multidrug efflux system membrane fusion protein